MKIRKGIIEQLLRHAREEAPFEACGYLAKLDNIVTTAYGLTNIDHSNEHFSFDPREQFAALKDLRAKGLEICAVYHSHPASPARPSAEDIKLAHDPDTLYVIISLAEGKEDIQAFRIKNQEVTPVSVEVINDKGI